VTGEKHPDTVYPVGFFLTTGVVPYEITPALCNCFAPLRGLHMASISQGKPPYPSEVGTALHGSSRAGENAKMD